MIRLRDVRSLEKDFEETLRKAVDRDFAKNDPGWLTDRNVRFLFLLDGFDELLMEGRTSGGLEEFLKQVGRFQESCQSNSEKGHRVLITGRTLSLQSIERFMPSNLERIELLPMDDALQNLWFTHWEKLVGTQKALESRRFLQSQECPDHLKELAKEPLLLYLVAAMQRDGELTPEIFAHTEGARAKVLIYKRALDWVLLKQRPKWLNRDLTELETESLNTILAEAGLCVIQSGGEFAPISMIEERLKNNEGAKTLLEEAQIRLRGEKIDPLRNALASFYLQPGRQGEGSVEFTHKSFSEFLCAERLKESILDWTSKITKRHGQENLVPMELMDKQIYDLLGYGGLTPEIVEYLGTLLSMSDEFDPLSLFQRLESFYLRWCEGGFIDAEPPTLPQQKMRLLNEQLKGKGRNLGQRQIDVYAGLNVIILLLELHRYAQSNESLKNQINFYLCSQNPNKNENWEDFLFDFRLSQIIGYSLCVPELEGFMVIVKSFLQGVNLQGAYLRGVYLPKANFRDANLQGIYLRGSCFINANFHNANLSGADLSGTNLRGANFNGANLSNVNLRGAYLSGESYRNSGFNRANFRGSDFNGANLNGANLENIFWDEHTQWEGIQGLETAINIPNKLKEQLGLE